MQKSKKGFTLLEVMVAISVMAIVLVAVYRMQSQTISMSSSAQFYTLAPLLAQRVMSEVELKTADDLASDSGNFGDDFPAYSWEVAVEDVESEILGETAKNLKQVNVRVSHEKGSSYEFRAYLYVEDEK